MRLSHLIVIAAVVLSACAPPPPTNTQSGRRIISAAEADSVRTIHVDTLNALRSERGLLPVKLSARLTAAALTHARDMSVQKRAWHFGSDGTSPKDRADRAGYAGQVLGENISESFDNEIELMQSWLAEPGTRSIMFDPQATDIGLGWFQESNGKLWWVQMIARSAEFAGGPSAGF